VLHVSVKQPRWTLARDERTRLLAAEGDVSFLDCVRALASRPWIASQLVRDVVRGGVLSAVSNGELVWAAKLERFKRLQPDAGVGAAWHGEEFFSAALLPLVDPRSEVLELGCGAGRVSRLVAPHVGRLLCTDVHRVMVEEARANLAGHPNVTCMRIDGLTLDGIADASVDVVFSHDVFVILDGNRALSLLDEARRVLRPGGHCVISVYAIDDAASARHQLGVARDAARANLLGTTVTWLRPYTGEFLEALLRSAGLTPLERRYDERPGADAGADDARPHCVVVAERPVPRESQQAGE
jgi:SAM-dependent methyltransferase